MSFIEITTFRNLVQRHSVTVFRYKCCVAKDITVGDRIRTQRKLLRMSVATLARAAGIAASTLYDLERGDSRSSTALPLLAAHLGLSARWLADKTGPRLVNELHGVRENAPVYGTPISSEEAEVGREWGKLQEPHRSVIYTQIQLLVAAQKRGERHPEKVKPTKSVRLSKGGEDAANN